MIAASESQKKNCGLFLIDFIEWKKTRTGNSGGSGLGLSISKWIVEAHDGVIDIARDEGKGTTIIIKPNWFSDYDASALANAEASFNIKMRKPLHVRYTIEFPLITLRNN